MTGYIAQVENMDILNRCMLDIVDKIRMDERVRMVRRLANCNPSELSIENNWKYDKLLEVISAD